MITVLKLAVQILTGEGVIKLEGWGFGAVLLLIHGAGLRSKMLFDLCLS